MVIEAPMVYPMVFSPILHTRMVTGCDSPNIVHPIKTVGRARSPEPQSIGAQMRPAMRTSRSPDMASAERQVNEMQSPDKRSPLPAYRSVSAQRVGATPMLSRTQVWNRRPSIPQPLRKPYAFGAGSLTAPPAEAFGDSVTAPVTQATSASRPVYLTARAPSSLSASPGRFLTPKTPSRTEVRDLQISRKNLLISSASTEHFSTACFEEGAKGEKSSNASQSTQCTATPTTSCTITPPASCSVTPTASCSITPTKPTDIVTMDIVTKPSENDTKPTDIGNLEDALMKSLLEDLCSIQACLETDIVSGDSKAHRALFSSMMQLRNLLAAKPDLVNPQGILSV